MSTDVVGNHPNSADTQFKPGQSGNPGGRPKMKAWRDALKREIEKRAEAGAEDKLASGLAKIAKAVVNNAELGDKDSWQEIGNRLDGKVAQAIIAAGDEDGGPIQHSHTVEWVSGQAAAAK